MGEKRAILVYRFLVAFLMLSLGALSYSYVPDQPFLILAVAALGLLIALFFPLPIPAEASSSHNDIYLNALEDKIMVAHLSLEGKITKINRSFCQILNLTKEEVKNNSFETFLTHLPDIDLLYEEIMSILASGQNWDEMLSFLPKGGHEIHLNCSIFPIKDAKGNLQEYLFTATDMTELIKNRQYLQERFYHDQLTGLPNRMKLIHDKQKLKVVHPLTLITFNIDRFQVINELYGNAFGDKVLKKVGQWLKNRLPNNQSALYKLESDNYAILVTNAMNPQKLKEYLSIISSNATAEHFEWDGTEVNITFTIGAVQAREDLLKLSKIAFKEAKKSGLPYVIYDENSEISKAHQRNIEVNRIIKGAVEESRVIPYFQPIVNLMTREIEKYEALMRIEMEDGTILLPEEFLEVAKSSKLYPKMSRELIKNTFEVFHISSNEFSINLSVLDLLNPQTTEFIIEQLETYNVGPWVVFELLESESIDKSASVRVKKFIDKVKSYGVKIAIDDFGSGYSNFERLLDLQVDYIKIDGSLIRNIDNNEDAEIITRTIVSFAKELGIQTIAEYVHSPEILQKIKSIGIDYAQGFYIGKPGPKFVKAEDERLA